MTLTFSTVFQYLCCSQEYFRQDLLAAPTQDLRLNKHSSMLDEEEEENQCEEKMNETINGQEEWKPVKQKRKEMKRAPNKYV